MIPRPRLKELKNRINRPKFLAKKWNDIQISLFIRGRDPPAISRPDGLSFLPRGAVTFAGRYSIRVLAASPERHSNSNLIDWVTFSR
jgi:hypothetical protein